MQRRQHCDGGVLQFALTLGRCVGEPVAAKGVGHDVGRHHTLDVVHQEEGRAQNVAGRLEPAHPRDRDIGQLSDHPYHVELVVEPVCREDLDVLGGGCDPGHQLLRYRPAVLLPAGGQDDGLRRHAGRVHTAFHGYLRRRAAGQDRRQPLRHHRGQGGDIAAGALKFVDFVEHRFVGHSALSSLRLLPAAITIR